MQAHNRKLALFIYMLFFFLFNVLFPAMSFQVKDFTNL